MKKGAVICAVCALLLLAVFPLVSGKDAAQLQGLEPSAERDFMTAELTYDAGTRTLRGTQAMTAQNRTGQALSEIVLRLYMNGLSGARVTVTGVTVNGANAAFALDEADSTVLRIAHGWQAGESAALSFTVMITHPKAEGAAIVTLPALAMWEDGTWRTDPYDELADPSYAAAFDYVLTLDGTLHSRLRGARDLSFALLPGGKTRVKEIGGVRVTAVAETLSAAGRLLNGAQEALGDLKTLGFAYPFDALTIAAGETGREDGMALSGLIVLPDEGNREALRQRLTRLIAQQTFGVLVENDPWNAPWLSRSLAACAELLCFRQRMGQAAYEERYFSTVEVASRVTRPAGVCVGAGTAFFGSDAEMTQVLRDQGAAMLMGIEAAIGEEAFLAALRAYAQENAGKTASQASLEAALLAASGSDWSGYLADELSF